MRLLGVAVLVGLVACKQDPTPRDRVLAILPADASAIFVADSAALGHPRLRPVIDALRPRWPTSMGCVIDAGLAADQVGIAATKTGTSIVMLTKKPITCPALSQLRKDHGVWVATIGEGVFASPTTPSVMIDARFARARNHLASAPIAATLESARFKTHIHASAQAEPLEAWVAFDADGAFADTLELGVKSVVDRMAGDSTTNGLAARITVTRKGSQIVARVSGKVDADLGAAAGTLVMWGWGQSSAAPPPTGWTCPAVTDLVLGCSSQTMRVASLASIATTMKGAKLSTIVDNGRVSGLRLEDDLPKLGLLRGDLVFACEGRPLANREQLVQAILDGPHQASITVRRSTVDTKLVFEE